MTAKDRTKRFVVKPRASLLAMTPIWLLGALFVLPLTGWLLSAVFGENGYLLLLPILMVVMFLGIFMNARARRKAAAYRTDGGPHIRIGDDGIWVEAGPLRAKGYYAYGRLHGVRLSGVTKDGVGCLDLDVVGVRNGISIDGLHRARAAASHVNERLAAYRANRLELPDVLAVPEHDGLEWLDEIEAEMTKGGFRDRPLTPDELVAFGANPSVASPVRVASFAVAMRVAPEVAEAPLAEARAGVVSPVLKSAFDKIAGREFETLTPHELLP